MRAPLVVAVTALAFGAHAQAAGAHAVVSMRGAALVYDARDDVSANTLVVAEREGRLRFTDPGSDGGIQWPPGCAPGRVEPATGFVEEVSCPRAGVRRILIDVGEAQDTVSARITVPLRVRGGGGADAITGGLAPDAISGGPGNDLVYGLDGTDRMAGGAGDDTLSGDAGDDLLRGEAGTDGLYGGLGADTLDGRDGEPDEAACGPQDDRLVADQFDAVIDTVSCETVDRAVVAPARGSPPGTRFDRDPPRVRAGGLTVQRLRGRTITVLATVDEPGEVAAAGYVGARGARHLLLPARARIAVAGAGVELRVRLARGAARRIRRVLARRGRATAVVTVVATDVAGNAASGKLRVRLRR